MHSCAGGAQFEAEQVNRIGEAASFKAAEQANSAAAAFEKSPFKHNTTRQTTIAAKTRKRNEQEQEEARKENHDGDETKRENYHAARLDYR